MQQNQLFIESLSDALDEAIKQLGGVKSFGNQLWPEKTIRDAGNQLLNCLNPEHAQKLSLEQIDFILNAARKEGVHVVPQYIGNQYGYKVIPIEPEDEKAELQRKAIQMTGDLKTLVNRLEKLGV